MKTSTTQNKDSRSMFARFGKIATALAFGALLCTFPIGSAWAARHHGGGGHAYHSGGHRGGWGHGGWGHGGGWGGYYGGPDYYVYGPDYYYVEPEPYAYYPPVPEYGPDYYPAPDGIKLFFHL